MPPITPDQIIGGINAAAQAASAAGSFMGGGPEGLSRNDQRFIAHKNMQWGDDALYRGLQIKTADAVAAGLHPLAALGAMPTNAPSLTGSGSEGPNLGDRLESMGQNVSRSIMANQAVTSRELLTTELENARKNGRYIEQQIAESKQRVLNMQGTPPAGPNPNNAGGSGDVVPTPDGNYLYVRQPDGSYRIEPSPSHQADASSLESQIRRTGSRAVEGLKQLKHNMGTEIRHSIRRLMFRR